MKLHALLVIVGLSTLNVACGATVDAPSAGSATVEGSTFTLGEEEHTGEAAEMDVMAMGERIGETGEASTAGDACAAACATAYAVLCARVTGLCGVAETVTLGGVTVPCATAMTAACIGGVALATVCGRRCPP